VSLTIPGPRATDARTAVTLRDVPGTPWPLTFWFLRVIDDDGEQQLVNVGFEMGEKFPIEPGARERELPEVPAAIDPVAVQRIAEAYANWAEYARLAIVVDEEGEANAIRRLRGPGRKPARLDPDFYRLLADEYRAHRSTGRPGRALAEKYHVNPSQVTRWVKKCVELGFLKEEER
jgi:hypothetical protein